MKQYQAIGCAYANDTQFKFTEEFIVSSYKEAKEKFKELGIKHYLFTLKEVIKNEKFY